MTANEPNVALDPSFFDGRFMVEIREWDWNLYVALSHPKFPRKYSFQGGLNYSRGIQIIVTCCRTAVRCSYVNVRTGAHAGACLLNLPRPDCTLVLLCA